MLSLLSRSQSNQSTCIHRWWIIRRTKVAPQQLFTLFFRRVGLPTILRTQTAALNTTRCDHPGWVYSLRFKRCAKTHAIHRSQASSTTYLALLIKAFQVTSPARGSLDFKYLKVHFPLYTPNIALSNAIKLG